MAVLVYLGVGISASPTRLPDALAEYFGGARVKALQKRVDALLREAWMDYADWEGLTLVQATDEVRDRVRQNHPELSDDAVWALAWNFSYASK
jgi:hypothetical protein